MTGRRPTKRIVAVATAAILLVAGGAALAQSQAGGLAAERQAFLDDVAKRLGVTPDALEQALADAQVARIDKALADGLITKEQADRLKERVRSGEGPLFGGPLERGFDGRHGPFGRGGPGFHHGHPAIFDAAAAYLGVSMDELRTALRDKSLADVAGEQGKSVDGLEQALVAAVKKDLAQAVEDGDLTQARKTEVLDRFREHVDDLVRRAGHGGPKGPWHRGGPPPGTPPDGTSFFFGASA